MSATEPRKGRWRSPKSEQILKLRTMCGGKRWRRFKKNQEERGKRISPDPDLPYNQAQNTRHGQNWWFEGRTSKRALSASVNLFKSKKSLQAEREEKNRKKGNDPLEKPTWGGQLRAKSRKGERERGLVFRRSIYKVDGSAPLRVDEKHETATSSEKTRRGRHKSEKKLS